MLAFHTSKTPYSESMLLCTWHACEQRSLCLHWKKLKLKLLYFENKARYRTRKMQADIFLKFILCDDDKNAKVCLLLKF